MRRILAVLGLLNVLALGTHAGLSYVEAGAAGYNDRPNGHLVFHTALGDSIGARVHSWSPTALLWLRSVARGANNGDTPLDVQLRVARKDLSAAVGGDAVGDYQFVRLYSAPLFVSTLLALMALAAVARWGDDRKLAATVVGWSIAFAFTMSVALPVLVPDFWLSFAWGRTLAEGGNPYYAVPASAITGLPFDDPILKMTYGPLWAHISHAVMAFAQDSTFAAAVAFKAIIVAAWVAILLLCYRLTSAWEPRERSVAMVVVGWLPLGAVQFAGDGHNDVVMMAFVLLWLLLLERGHLKSATTALALSVAVKYVSAPLFALDALHHLLSDPSASVTQRIRTYVPRALLAVVVWVAAFAPLFDSAAFFRETTAVREGFFYLPADAVKALGTVLNRDVTWVAYGLMVLFPVVTVALIWRYWQVPNAVSFRFAVAGVMLSVLFIAAGHVWPWYVVWFSLPAALTPVSSRVARWAAGIALAAPFPLAVWIAYPAASSYVKFERPSLVMYTVASVWLLVAWRLFAPRSLRTQPAP